MLSMKSYALANLHTSSRYLPLPLSKLLIDIRLKTHLHNSKFHIYISPVFVNTKQ
jgi:hypothetical protein